jgi:hypothetical protein
MADDKLAVADVAAQPLVPKDAADAITEEVDMNLASIRELYRYATPSDIVVMIVGIPCAGAVGAIQPLIMVLFADVMDAASGTGDLSSQEDAFNNAALNFLCSQCECSLLCGRSSFGRFSAALLLCATQKLTIIQYCASPFLQTSAPAALSPAGLGRARSPCRASAWPPSGASST